MKSGAVVAGCYAETAFLATSKLFHLLEDPRLRRYITANPQAIPLLQGIKYMEITASPIVEQCEAKKWL
jgi:hypothetical protein